MPESLGAVPPPPMLLLLLLRPPPLGLTRAAAPPSRWRGDRRRDGPHGRHQLHGVRHDGPGQAGLLRGRASSEHARRSRSCPSTGYGQRRNRARAALLDAEPTTAGVFASDNICLSGTHPPAPAGFLSRTVFQVTCSASSSGPTRRSPAASPRPRRRRHPAGARLPGAGRRRAGKHQPQPGVLVQAAEERARWAKGRHDKGAALLKFLADDADRTPLGMVNWFSVHGTSMNNTNKLVSGDNKGASLSLRPPVPSTLPNGISSGVAGPTSETSLPTSTGRSAWIRAFHARWSTRRATGGTRCARGAGRARTCSRAPGSSANDSTQPPSESTRLPMRSCSARWTCGTPGWT